MSQITVQDWAFAEACIAKEKRISRMILAWEAIEPPPFPFVLTFDWGYRTFVNPQHGATEDDLHRLLAWFVRQSGKKFEREIREAGSIFWWNRSSESFLDAGDVIQALIFLENYGAGKCKIVEETKTVTVKKLVCEEAAVA